MFDAKMMFRFECDENYYNKGSNAITPFLFFVATPLSF